MYNYYPWYGYPIQPYGSNFSQEGARQQPPMNGNGFNGNGMNGNGQALPPIEQSYIENILRMNLGKRARVHMTFENNPDWQSRVFVGILDEAGRDHIVIRDEKAGKWYLLLMVYLDFVEFDEEIEYEYPFNDVDPSAYFSQYPPR